MLGSAAVNASSAPTSSVAGTAAGGSGCTTDRPCSPRRATPVSDRIELRGLRVRGYHGVLPEERRDGQLFGIDVVIETDVRDAAAADDLAATVDYSTLAKQVESVVAGTPVDLIETLASRLAD